MIDPRRSSNPKVDHLGRSLSSNVDYPRRSTSLKKLKFVFREKSSKDHVLEIVLTIPK